MKLGWLFCIGCLAINCIGTSLFLTISSLNYPGGEALEKLHKFVPCEVQGVKAGNLPSKKVKKRKIKN